LGGKRRITTRVGAKQQQQQQHEEEEEEEDHSFIQRHMWRWGGGEERTDAPLVEVGEVGEEGGVVQGAARVGQDRVDLDVRVGHGVTLDHLP
jgi:hypothetical protein